MAKSDIVILDTKTEVVDENESPVVVFKKPYVFEGVTYNEIDLSGLETLTVKAMCETEKFLNRAGLITPLPEMTAEYICQICYRITQQPLEFFYGLPPREFAQIKTRVMRFFYGEE